MALRIVVFIAAVTLFPLTGVGLTFLLAGR